MVQLNGIALPGTWLMIVFASASMNVMPRNSGASNVRRATSKSWSACLMRLGILEHMFERRPAEDRPRIFQTSEHNGDMSPSSEASPDSTTQSELPIQRCQTT